MTPTPEELAEALAWFESRAKDGWHYNEKGALLAAACRAAIAEREGENKFANTMNRLCAIEADKRIAAESALEAVRRELTEAREQTEEARNQLGYMAEGIYRGNTISYIYDKMTCYGDQVMMAFNALRLLGWKDESSGNKERAVALKAWAQARLKERDEVRELADSWCDKFNEARAEVEWLRELLTNKDDSLLRQVAALTARIAELQKDRDYWRKMDHQENAKREEVEVENAALQARISVAEPLCRLAARANSLAFDNPECAVRLTPALKAWAELENKS